MLKTVENFYTPLSESLHLFIESIISYIDRIKQNGAVMKKLLLFMISLIAFNNFANSKSLETKKDTGETYPYQETEETRLKNFPIRKQVLDHIDSLKGKYILARECALDQDQKKSIGSIKSISINTRFAEDNYGYPIMGNKKRSFVRAEINLEIAMTDQNPDVEPRNPNRFYLSANTDDIRLNSKSISEFSKEFANTGVMLRTTDTFNTFNKSGIDLSFKTEYGLYSNYFFTRPLKEKIYETAQIKFSPDGQELSLNLSYADFSVLRSSSKTVQEEEGLDAFRGPVVEFINSKNHVPTVKANNCIFKKVN
jgi:hypothetical protein